MEDKVEAGYIAEKIYNPYLQNILEEEMEGKLDNNGYLFSDNGKSYRTCCVHC